MASHTFFCIDSHTCGCPVRVVAGGAPPLRGASASERRQHLLAEYDWVRTGLMFEPRGHDMMSGSILYPPTRPDCDLGIIFIETSGSLPMCGHGTIGTVTVALERGLVHPKTPGKLRLDTPAGVVEATYVQNGEHIDTVRIVNVPSYVHATGIEVDCPEYGALTINIAYGGNFYAIVEPQKNYRGLEHMTANDIIRLSPTFRARVNAAITCVHPEDETIRGVEHIMWTGKPSEGADGKSAVFTAERAIDRSPCGTGTSARMALLHARGELKQGQDYVHESFIGSLFRGRVEGLAKVGNHPAVIPSIEGWARITGYNTIFIDDRDPYAHGFTLP